MVRNTNQISLLKVVYSIFVSLCYRIDNELMSCSFKSFNGYLAPKRNVYTSNNENTEDLSKQLEKSEES